MEKKLTYTSFDGWEFDNYEDCLAHEEYLQKLKENSNNPITIKVNNKEITLLKTNIVEIFNGFKCENCPFKEECDTLYAFTRMYSTNTLRLCEVIENKVEI